MDVLVGKGLPLMLRSVIAAILYGVITTAVDAQAPTPGSVDAGGNDEQSNQDVVIVTGSNIRRADLESTVPVTVIDQNAMEVRNPLLPADMLTALPSVVSLPENETRLGSSGARGDNANINRGTWARPRR